MNFLSFKHFKGDFAAGITVFLIAVPLCLGIALASGAPLLSGLISGIVAGLVVSLLSGSELSISGPAASLALILAGGVKELGSFEAVLAAVIFSGVIQVFFGLIRIGDVGGLFPISVIQGMLSAIGLLIISRQIPHALGRDLDFEGDTGFWSLAGDDNVASDIIKAFYSYTPGAVMIAALSIVFILAWDHPRVKNSPLKMIPGALVGILVGVALNRFFIAFFPTLAVTVEEGHLVNIPKLSGVGDFFSGFASLKFVYFEDFRVLKLGFTIALIGSLESVLSVQATEKLDPFRRISFKNKELIAQGVGNTISGLLGGIPMTSAVIRSSANIYSGAKTRLSCFIHGLFLAVTLLCFPRLLNHIPFASLAAVLILVGYRLTSLKIFSQMKKEGLSQFLPFIATIVAIIATDLMKGVLLGLVVGLGIVIYSNLQSSITMIKEGNNVLVRFSKDVSFVNKQKLKRILREIEPGSHVFIDGTKAAFIDFDIYDTVQDFLETAKHRNINVELKNLVSKQYPKGRFKKFL